MNSNVEGNGITDPTTANNLIQQVQFNGMTPLGSSLDSKVSPSTCLATSAGTGSS